MRLFSERFVGNLFTATPQFIQPLLVDLSFARRDAEILFLFTGFLLYCTATEGFLFFFLLLSSSFLLSAAFFRRLLQSYPTVDVNWFASILGDTVVLLGLSHRVNPF